MGVAGREGKAETAADHIALSLNDRNPAESCIAPFSIGFTFFLLLMDPRATPCLWSLNFWAVESPKLEAFPKELVPLFPFLAAQMAILPWPFFLLSYGTLTDQQGACLQATSMSHRAPTRHTYSFYLAMGIMLRRSPQFPSDTLSVPPGTS